ncbi:STAS domain-containing protein [Thalassotalea euphylliae]|uniref:STAS domain-containing protein n=1 Tax=Thalassotalea euphylliae TaxID=1655234 RepID=UPI00363EE312
MLGESNIVLNKIESAVLATIQSALTDEVLNRFREDLLTHLSATSVKYLLCDFSGLDLLDIDEYQSVQKICQMAQLMGVTSIIVGLSPGLAATIVDYDIDTKNIRFALNIDEGLLLVREGG